MAFLPTNAEFEQQRLSEKNHAWKQGVMGSLNVAAMILATRLIVLVAVLGAIALSYQALGDPQLYRVLTLVAYGLLVVGPVVWLAASGRA